MVMVGKIPEPLLSTSFM